MMGPSGATGKKTARLAAGFLLLYVIIVRTDGSAAGVTTVNGSTRRDRADVIEQNYFDLSPKLTLMSKSSNDTTGDENGQRQSDSEEVTSSELDLNGLIRNKVLEETDLQVNVASNGETDEKLLLEDSGIPTTSKSHVAAGIQPSSPNTTKLAEDGQTNTTDEFTATETTWSETPVGASTGADLLENYSTSTTVSGTLEYFELDAEFSQKILDGLDGIIVDLEDLHGMFRNHSSFSNQSDNTSLSKRVVRAALPPTKPRAECRVTHDQLRELNRDIREKLSSLPSLTSNPPQCTLDETNANNCDEWVTSIQCGMLHLKYGFQQAIKGKVSLSQVTLWRNAYESLKATFDREADDIRASVSQEYQLKIDKLKTDLHDLQQYVTRLEHKLEQQRLELIRTKTESCAKSVRFGEVDRAIEEFKELDDDSLLSKIVSQAYTGDSTHLSNVIVFLKKLPYCHQVQIASPVVFEQMQANGHLTSPQVFSLSRAVQYCSSLNFPALKVLMTQLEDPKNSVMETWGAEIRSGELYEVTSYAKGWHGDFVGYLEQVIKKAFSDNIHNAEKVINFVDVLPYLEQQVVGYPSLFDVITRSNGLNGHELIMLAYRCKHRIENMGYASAEQRQRLENIKGRLPDGIRALLWDSFVYIKSRKHSGYYLCLREVPQGAYLSAHGFGSTNKFDPYACESSQNGQWSVTQRQKGRYFRFNNNNQDCGSFGANRCTPEDSESQYEWEVIPVWNGEAFYLKRTDDQRFLSVADMSGWSKFWSQVPSDCDEVERKDSLDYDLSLWSIS